MSHAMPYPTALALNCQSILDSLLEGAYVVDQERRILAWNKSAEEITGYGAASVVGSRCSDNILRHVDENGACLCDGGCPLHACLAGEASCERTVWLHHAQGWRQPVRVRAAPLLSHEGSVVGAIELFLPSKSSAARRAEDAPVVGGVDELTGLGDRRAAHGALETSLRVMRTGDGKFGLLFIDVDNLKSINDGYGHLVGDRIIRMVARTIHGALRADDVSCRWGGDEFLAIISRVDVKGLLQVAQRIRAMAEESWLDLGTNERLTTTVSIGGAMAQESDDMETLLHRADMAMYDCKRKGRNSVAVRNDDASCASSMIMNSTRCPLAKG